MRRLGDALAIEVDLELAGEIIPARAAAEVEQVVPFAHAPHALAEMRGAQQGVQLAFAHATGEQAQGVDIHEQALLQRGFARIREARRSGVGGVGVRSGRCGALFAVAGAGAQQQGRQAQAQ
ncbi:hypothetical protein D3C71_1522130 [compost metagenome]